jgi:hypothetical protein
MSYLKSSDGYLSISDQASKGTPIAYDAVKAYVKYLEESFATEHDIQQLREGGDGEVIAGSIKNLHKEKFAFKLYARPQIIAYLMAWTLGADSKSGGSDPYTHEITRLADGRKYLTLFRKLNTSVIQKLYDAKIETITLEMEAGKPVMVTVEGNACNAALESTEGEEDYETDPPFVMYHGDGAFEIDEAAQASIRKCTIKISIKSQEGLQSDGLRLEDLPDLQYDIDVTCELYAEDTSFFKKINYYNTSAPSEDVYSGALSIDLTYTNSSSKARELKIEIPDVAFQPVTGVNLKSEPAVMVQTIAGVARLESGSELMTVTIQNDLSADLA